MSGFPQMVKLYDVVQALYPKVNLDEDDRELAAEAWLMQRPGFITAALRIAFELGAQAASTMLAADYKYPSLEEQIDKAMAETG
jgi:hypothetical protein